MPAKTAPSTLDGHAAEIWESAYASAWDAYDPDKHTGSQEEYAAKTAWAAVKSAGYEKGEEGNWVKTSHSTLRLPLRFAKVRRDETTGIVTFHAQAACTELDTSGTEVLEPELFDDLAVTFQEITAAMDAGIELPDYWFGRAQEPILDLTHYSSFLPLEDRNQARLGVITNVYRDGRFLHVDGVFDDTEIGQLAAQAVLANEANAIRTSVGFWPDWGNLSIVDGVTHFKGGRGAAVLDHLALTTVPRIPTTSIMANAQEVNAMSDDVTKTLAEDALEILGEDGTEMVETLDAAAQEEMQRDSMVTLSDDADVNEAPADVPVEEAVVEETEVEDVADPEVVVDSEADSTDDAIAEEVVVPDPDAEPVEATDSVVVESEGDIIEETVVVAEVPAEEDNVEIEASAEEVANVEPDPDPVVASEIVPPLADGGGEIAPTTFDDALAVIQARKEAYRIEDGLYVLQDVINAIMASPLIEDKAAAINEAMSQYQAFLTSGVEVYSEADAEGTTEDVVETEEVVSEPDADAGVIVDVGDVDPLSDLSAEVRPVEAEPLTQLDPGLISQAGAVAEDDEGYVRTPHKLGRAGTFSDALARISNAPDRTGDQPALRSRQAQLPVAVPPPAAALPASFAGTEEDSNAAQLAAMVADIVSQIVEPLRTEVASLRARLEGNAVPVNEAAPPASRPQRRSTVDTQPPVKPARVTTRAKTFGEAIDRLASQDDRGRI